jgi:NitT/TauT family transport system substrate-binding protein
MSKTRVLTKVLAGAVALATGIVATAAIAQDEINVRFSWKLKGEYGFLYYGQQAGVFEDNGINLILGEGAGSQAALGALIQGQEDVVIMPAIFAISAIQKGMPVKIAALYQPAAPVVLISHPENPVLTPKDLEGKTIAHSVGETGTSYLNVFCEINAIDCSKLSMVLMDSGVRVPQFLQNQVDVVSVYLTNDLPTLIEQTGVEYPVLDLAEFGLAVPGLAVVVSDDSLGTNADALTRFLAATAEAIEMTRADPAAATAALMAVWTTSPSAAVVQAQIEATSASFHTAEGKPLGWIDEASVTNALALMASTGDMEDPKPAATFYTNALLGE